MLRRYTSALFMRPSQIPNVYQRSVRGFWYYSLCMATRRGPDNTARISITGTADTHNWANIFSVSLTPVGAVTSADFLSYVTAFASAFKTNFAPRQCSNVAYALARGVFFAPGGGELSAESTMTGNGTNGGACLPDDSAAEVISWLTTVYWRGGKPRTYLAGVPQPNMQTGSSLSAAEVTALTTAAGTFRTAINALTETSISSSVLGFISYQSGNVPRTPPVFFAFTGATVHHRIGTQRRRLGKWVP